MDAKKGSALIPLAVAPRASVTVSRVLSPRRWMRPCPKGPQSSMSKASPVCIQSNDALKASTGPRTAILPRRWKSTLAPASGLATVQPVTKTPTDSRATRAALRQTRPVESRPMALSTSILAKLTDLSERHEELAALLADPEVVSDRDRFTALSREYAELEPVIAAYQGYRRAMADLEEAKSLEADEDEAIRELAREDAASTRTTLAAIETTVKTLLIPKDPNDERNVFLEIRAGTGGDEAALFAGDLYRMYTRYAEDEGWRVGILSDRAGEHGGFKEIIARVEGRRVYSRLKFESGAHRVQRVPETESQGRIHTSACTVAVLAEQDAIDDVDVDKADLRVDTFRASGAGGQHVNKTDSAVRLTHIPTGIVVECQDERSQLKNRARAMQLLHAKLLDAAQAQQTAEQAETRRSLVGSGDRSERIRTYNFPQGRVTDHRIGLTLYKLDEVIAGRLDHIIEPLTQEHQADQLKRLGEPA